MTPRTPGNPRARTAVAIAVARAFTAASIRGSSSSSSAASPASRTSATTDTISLLGGHRVVGDIAPLVATGHLSECGDQFLVDAAEPAVRHQDDHVALAPLGHDRPDDRVVVGEMP